MEEPANIRAELPEEVASRLLPDEPAYFYAVWTGGCLSGEKEWFALTDRRVLMTTKEDNRRGTVDIPIEQIASVSSFIEKSCWSAEKGAIVVSATGGTTSRVVVGSTENADRGTGLVQVVLGRRRGGAE